MLKVTPHRCHPEKRAVGERAVGKQARKYSLLTSGMYFPILHIFNVGTPYTQTPDRHQTDDSLIISDRTSKVVIRQAGAVGGDEIYLRVYLVF
jgi:hypothetical protein